ncbi:MAG: hypothetical protein A2X32_00240 [Elusimicrobia bacterium GWC2_64_44]|nr:MAG: hypothetical protein A2X32_00240 [Elusimicrobia bacterium GWC2_64_44]
MRTGGTLACAAALLLAAAPAFAAGELQLAREAAALGSEARAFDLAADGLKQAPADRDLFLYAVELLPENSTARAKTLSAAAAARLAKDGADYPAYLGLCKALRVLSKASEALANCKKALELEPTAYPVYRELGLTYASAGNPRKATETLSQGVEISSTSCQAHYHLARALEKRGDAARAAASYKQALACAGTDTSPDAGYYRALSRSGLKRTAAAKERPAGRLPAQASPARKQLAAACAAKFREEFLKDNLGMALQQSDACLKYSPSDPDLAAERAPLLVRLGRYEEGVKEYERAAGLLPAKSQAAALLRVKAAETWQKLGRQDDALAQYRLARAASPQDMNALKGLAAALEARSDFSGAVEVYGEILKLEPGNAQARARREELRASALSDPQILEELKFREALEKNKTALQPDDIKLFRRLKAAELSGAVDYLKARLPAGRGLTIRRTTPEGIKILLTGAGYKAYVFHASRDAVKFFESEKIGMREIFQLRSETGAPLFDKSGRLTQEGEELWRGSVPGKKTWLMPYDQVPDSAQAKASKEAQAKVDDALRQGYQEISEPEYLWLLTATSCTDDIMMNDPVNMKMVLDGANRRYLMCFSDRAPCATKPNIVLPSYIVGYRENKHFVPGSSSHSGFFGSGPKKYRYCENGKIWDGTPGGAGAKIGP